MHRTSEDWLCDFFDRVAAVKNGEAPPLPRDRRKAIEERRRKANAILEAAGI
ncbi:hypothetical protein [Rosistilla carotiformis]|uniref:hypothetical protein n=1 Tax=Rosistilla carotiformis TaxID=2528017 RepID=UPI0018D25C65|nr:hypothetical protein [Rosistilla carotiformis]